MSSQHSLVLAQLRKAPCPINRRPGSEPGRNPALIPKSFFSRKMNPVISPSSSSPIDPGGASPTKISDRESRLLNRDLEMKLQSPSVPTAIPAAKVPSYAARFKSSLRNVRKIQAPSFLEDGTPVVQAPESVPLQTSELWKDHVVAHFHGRRPSASKIITDLNPTVMEVISGLKEESILEEGEIEDKSSKWSQEGSFETREDDSVWFTKHSKNFRRAMRQQELWKASGAVGTPPKSSKFLIRGSSSVNNVMIHEFEQLRVSGLMTNAPYMLNVDCDMYANEADVVRQAMCVFLQKSKSPDRCAFVQFPQEFYDSNSNELAVVQSYLGRGVAGIQGPLYCGSGCFHTRRVMYGLSPDDLENNGDLSSAATKFLDEDSLARKFGSSKELLGCLYDSVAEDMNTSIGIHLRGWSSSYICPDPPAFLGSTPSVGFEAIVQQRRWGTGAIEVLFNKQSPLRGMFSSKIRFRQRLAYLWVLMCLRSITELFYCLLPAYCLLRNTALYPKGPCLAITVTIVAMHCLYTLWQFINNGFSVRSWYVSQSLWRILATCGWLFSLHDILLKLLGISNVGFVVAKKTIPKTTPISGYVPIQRQDEYGLSSQ
ncbi:unnamed protein product [Brassica oleracea]